MVKQWCKNPFALVCIHLLLRLLLLPRPTFEQRTPPRLVSSAAAVTRNTTLVCKLHAVESKCACRSEGRQWGTRQWTKVSRSACVCIFFKQYICTGPPNLPQKRGLTSHLTPSSTEIPPGRAFGRGSHSISVAKAVDFIRIPSTFFPNWRNFFLTKYFVFFYLNINCDSYCTWDFLPEGWFSAFRLLSPSQKKLKKREKLIYSERK